MGSGEGVFAIKGRENLQEFLKGSSKFVLVKFMSIVLVSVQYKL